MRQVFLNAEEGAPPVNPRLMRHLMGRMLELAEDGVEIPGEQDPFVPRGAPIKLRFAGMDDNEITRLLAERYGVFLLRGADGTVSLSPAPGITFEDIDYAQGAIYSLLYP